MGLFSSEIYLHKSFLGKAYLEVKNGELFFWEERGVLWLAIWMGKFDSNKNFLFLEQMLMFFIFQVFLKEKGVWVVFVFLWVIWSPFPSALYSVPTIVLGVFELYYLLLWLLLECGPNPAVSRWFFKIQLVWCTAVFRWDQRETSFILIMCRLFFKVHKIIFIAIFLFEIFSWWF